MSTKKTDPVYPCTFCGACCRHLDLIDSKLPYDETGRCDYLVDTVDSSGRDISVCSVYETRESLGCSTTSSMKPDNLSWYEFFCLGALGCNTLQEYEGLDASYRVVIDSTE